MRHIWHYPLDRNDVLLDTIDATLVFPKRRQLQDDYEKEDAYEDSTIFDYIEDENEINNNEENFDDDDDVDELWQWKLDCQIPLFNIIHYVHGIPRLFALSYMLYNYWIALFLSYFLLYCVEYMRFVILWFDWYFLYYVSTNYQLYLHS